MDFQAQWSLQSQFRMSMRYQTRGPTLLEISYTFDEIFRNLHRNPEIFAEIYVLKSRTHRLLLC